MSKEPQLVFCEPIPVGEAPELSRYAEQLRRDVLALEKRLLAEIATRRDLESRLSQLEESE